MGAGSTIMYMHYHNKVGLDDDDDKEEVVERVYFNDLRSKLGRK